ncbi:MauE/DoxX family redox-associated membrane protein [Lentzea tibetensis]
MVYLALACRLLLLGVFLVALVSKMRAYREFERSLTGLVPGKAIRPAAALTTAAEAAAVVLLALPHTGSLGFALAGLLLAAFVAGIVLGLRRGTTAPCRCFGASETPLGWPHVIRNAVLLCAAALGLITGPAVPTEIGGIAVTAACAAIAGLAVVRLDDLVALFRPLNTAS